MNAPLLQGGPPNKLPLELDRERVTCLLLINAQLIKKAYTLHNNFLGNPQALQQLPPQTRSALQDQHNNLSRRVQCNIAVLAFINDKYHNKAAAQQPNRPQFPIILSAPQDMPELNAYYKKLQDLYPEALHFLKMKIQQMKSHQENQMNQQPPPRQPMKDQFAGQGSFNPQSNFPVQMDSQPPHLLNQQAPGPSISPQQILQSDQGFPNEFFNV